MDIPTYNKIIASVTTFKELENKISDFSIQSKGYIFELLTKYIFETREKNDCKKVYLYNEIPKIIKDELILPDGDMGIDLLVVKKDGTYVSIQCKYRSDIKTIISWKELSKFVGLSFGLTDKIMYGYYVTNTCEYCEQLVDSQKIKIIGRKFFDTMEEDRFEKIKMLIKDKYNNICYTAKNKKIIENEIILQLSIFETLENNYILFEKVKIIVIIDNNDKIWFNSKQLAKSIGYLDTKDAIKSHTSKTDRKQLKDINHSYNIIQHAQTVYLSESGMYKLILRSKMPKTEKFSNWVTEDVLPSIRKYGTYELKKSFEKEKNIIMKQINYYEKQIKLIKNDLKKNKFPDGALVYVLDYSDEDENVDGIFRIGKTNNLKTRKTIYDTHMLHNKKVIDYELSDTPLQLENCLKSMLYEYRYKDRKDFFICKLSVIKKAFKNCLKGIKNMGQTGGGLTMIKQLHNKVTRLDKKINKCELLLEK